MPEVIIQYKSMTEQELRFFRRLRRWSLWLFCGSVVVGLLLLFLGLNFSAVRDVIPGGLAILLLCLLGGLACLGAVGLVVVLKRYRADSMLRQGRDVREIYTGNVGITVILLVPLSLAALYLLGQSVPMLCIALFSIGRKEEANQRPLFRWNRGLDGKVANVAFGPQGEILATAYGKVTAWNIEGKVESGFPKPGRVGPASSCRPELSVKVGDVSLDVVGSSPPTIQVRSADRLMGELKGHEGSVECLALSADGKWAASGGADRIVHIWDVAQLKEKYRLEGHKKPVKYISLSGDGRQALSSAEEPELRLWDLGTGKEQKTFRPYPESNPREHCLSANGKHAFINYSRSCCLLDVESGEAKKKYSNEIFSLTHLAVSNDGSYVIKSDGSSVDLLELR